MSQVWEESVRVDNNDEIWHYEDKSRWRLVMKNPTLLVFLVAIFGIMLLPLSQGVKILLVVFVLAAVIYWKRGYFLVAMGSRALNAAQPDEEKAWRLYKRAWKAGLPTNYTIMLGNLFVQRGDAATGLEVYESVLEKEKARRQSDGEIIISARISRTMALWVLGRKSEAIGELQELYDEGRRDKTLLINLGTYLLHTDRLEEAGNLLEECADQVAESPGMTDNKGLYLYKTGALLDAKRVYDELLEGEGPKFPEAFVHGALVMIALGKSRKAKFLLQRALEREFFRTSTTSKEEVNHMLEELEEHPEGDDDEDVEDELASSLYDNDLFDDDSPNTEVDEDDELEPNIELDPEDYKDDDPEVVVDPEEMSELESELFDDEYEDGDEEPRK